MINQMVPTLIFSLITSFREILEAVLIIAIVISYLAHIQRKDLYRDVYLGVSAAVVFSIVMGVVFIIFFDRLKGYQELFEGIIMILAAVVLTWMILWMKQQSSSIKNVYQTKIDSIITEEEKLGLFFLVFFSVAREGAELVLFLYSNYLTNLETIGFVQASFGIISGFIIGLVIAGIISYFLFNQTRQLPLKQFFNVTSIILIFFAAGLLAHGLHEIFEFLETINSNLVDLVIWQEVWNINNTPLGDILQFLFGWSYDVAYPTRFEKSLIGSLLVSLFGWNDNPALIEILIYFSYFVIISYHLGYLKIQVTQKNMNKKNS